nr:restriction endonuclease subunit S [uncultured Tolumonas sp.]
MKSEYNKKPIREFGRVVTGKTPPKKIETAFGDLYPFITPRDLDGSKFIIKTERYLSEDGLASVKNNVIPSDSVLVSCIGSDMGKVSLSTVKSVTNQQINTIIIDTSKHNPEYVYYALSLEKASLMRAAGGTTMPILNKTSFENYEIYSPDKEIQDQIVSVVKPIDEKIAHNIAMNQTLEKIAQRIFKSWFIDFDPVKANAEGVAFNGLSPEIQALFPKEFEESELGMIPKGWLVKNLSECTDIKYGKNLPTTNLVDSGYPVYGGNGVIGFYNSYLYDKEKVLISCRGAASGKVLRSVAYSFITNNSLVIDDLNSDLNVNYLEMYLKQIDLIKYVTGSAQPQMTIANISQAKIMIPSVEILEAFDVVVGSLIEKATNNTALNFGLAKIRDRILPRLISGKITVSDANQELKETD